MMTLEALIESPQSVVYVDIRIPLAATEQVFLQLAVQAAIKKFRELQADASVCADPEPLDQNREVAV